MSGSSKIVVGVVGALAIFLIATKLRGDDKYSVEFGPIEILPGCRDVVLLGDSITAGINYRRHLEELLGPCNTVAALGYPNMQTGEILDHIDEALALEPTDIVVLAGVNDLAGGKSANQIIDNLEKIYDGIRVRDENVRVIAVTLTPWSSHYKGKNLQDETADINSYILFNSTADATVDAYNVTGQGTDGLHLTVEGQKQLAMEVYVQGFVE